MVNFGYANNFGTGAFNSRFKNPYNFSSGRVDSDTSNAIFDAIKRRQQMELDLDEERSLLDRTFDTLLMPNYIIAGAVDGMVRDDRTVLGGMYDGLRAGNPFGEGYTQGETTFSNVLEHSGWEGNSGFSKFARGATGFVLDVALDPTTYLTGGVSAIVRGTGRTGKGVATALEKLSDIVPEVVTGGKPITEMTDDIAKWLIKSNPEVSSKMSAEQLATEASEFTSKYNKMLGIRDVGGKGKAITLGVENLPFGDKLAPKLGVFGKTLKLSDGNAVRSFSDKIGIARAYSGVRDSMYGSKIGKLFSNNAPLKKLAETNPAELYNFMNSVNITKGLKISKLEKDKLIMDKAKALMNLTPADQKEIIRLLENEQTFTKVKDTLNFAQTNAGKDIVKVLESTKQQKAESASDVEHIKNILQGIEKNESISATEREIVKKLQGEVNDKIIKSDVKYYGKNAERNARIDDLKARRDELAKNAEATVKVNEPVTPEVSLRQLYDDAVNERQSWSGEREMGAILRESGVSDKRLRERGTKVVSERKLRDSMQSFLYGGTNKRLSKDFRVSNMGSIIEMMESVQDTEKLFNMLASGKTLFGGMNAKGANDLLKRIEKLGLKKVVGDYIDNNPALFSEHANDVYRYLAKKHGFKSFSEDVKKPLAELKKKDMPTPHEKKEIARLERITNQRKAEFNTYFHTMTHDDFLTKIGDKEARELREAFHEMVEADDLVKTRNRFIQEDGAGSGEARKITTIKTTGKGDDAKFAGVGSRMETPSTRRTGEFDEKVRLEPEVQFSNFERQQMKKHLDLEWANEIKRIQLKNPSYSPNNTAFKAKAIREDAIETAMKEFFPQHLFSDLSTAQKGFLMGMTKQIAKAHLKNPKDVKKIITKAKADMVRKAIRDKDVERTIALADSAKVGRVVQFKQGDEIVEGTITGKIPNKIEMTRERVEIENKSVEYLDAKGNKKLRAERVPTKKVDKYEEADGTYSLNVKLADGTEVSVHMSDVKNVRNAEDMPVKEFVNETEVVTKSVADMDTVAKELSELDAQIKRETKNAKSATRYHEKKRQTLVDELNSRSSTHLKRIEDLEQVNRDAKQVMQELASRYTDASDLEIQHLDNIIDAMYKGQKEIEDALLSDEALEKYVIGSRGHEFVEEALFDANVRNSKIINLSERASSKTIESWVLDIRQTLINAGAKEVEINKLGKEAFVAMMEKYVPRIPTEEGQRYFQSMKEINAHGTFVTSELGYGQKWNPFSKSRKIKGENIDEINEYFAKNKGIEKVFKDNIAEIFIDRMLKHNELVYDNEYMNVMMKQFGHEITGEIREGYKAVANFGEVKQHIHNQAKILVKGKVREYRQATGALGDALDDATMARLYDEALDDAMENIGFTRNALDAYAMPMLELTEEQMEKLVPLGIAREVSDVIVNRANQTRMLAMAKDESRALQMYDKFLHFIKLQQTVIMPSFHIRNKLSNVYQNWLGVGRDSFDIRFQRDATKASLAMGDLEKLKKIRPIVTDDGSKVYHWDEIVDLASKHGGIDDGYFAQDIGAGSSTRGLFKDKIPAKWNPTDTANFKPYQMGTKVGSTIENSDRLLHIASLLKQGRTIQEAVESSIKYLFDYSDLTMFEKSVMKRIFPYYTWLRKNARLQVESVIDQPNKFALTEKAMNGIEGMVNEEDKVEDKYVSDFARDWIQTPFSFGGKEKKDENGEVVGTTPKEPLLLSPNLPFMDIGRIPDPSQPLQSLRELVAQTAPAIKLPIELAMNKNMFFDSEITSRDEEGKQVAPITSRLAHIASQLAMVNAVNGGVDKSAGDFGLNALSVLGGVKMTAYDYEASKRRTVEEHYKKLYERTVLDDLKDGTITFLEDLDTSMRNGIVKLAGTKPLEPHQYKGALSPISATTYNKLSDEEKAKYSPPTEKQMMAYHKRAEELSKQAYEDTGSLKKFIWSAFESDKPMNERVVNVKKVTDGDTFTVELDGELKDIRLMLVDTPESAGSYKDNPMPFGKEASDFSKQMLMGKDVRLYIDGTDKYGRVLAYVELADEDYNKELLRQGLGQVRYLFGNESPKVNEYYGEENRAYQGKKGIWSIDGYATPNDDTGFNWNK